MPGCFLKVRDEGSGATSRSIYNRGGCGTRTQQALDLFALGDSHTIGYTTMLTGYVLRTGAQVTLYPNFGCSFASLKPSRDAGECQGQNQAGISNISKRTKPGDILFLAALRLERLSNQDLILELADRWQGMATALAEQGRQTASAQLITMLEPLRDKGIGIVFEAPKPLFRSPAFRCSDWFNRNNPICIGGLAESRAAIEAYRQPVLDSLNRLATALAASIRAPLAVLCPKQQCEAFRDQSPLYFDGDHLSAEGNRLLLPLFVTFLTRLTDTQTDQQDVRISRSH